MLRQFGVAMLAGLLSMNLYGCALFLGAAAGGAGAAVWLSGKMTAEVEASYDQTISAAKRALESLDLIVHEEHRTDEMAKLESTYTDGDKIWIDITPLTKRTTKIEVRVGVEGDESDSALILERIKRYL